MNILVTGASGFIGSNLSATLHNIKDGKDKSFGISRDINIFEYDIGKNIDTLEKYCKEASFVFHFAGVNRPQNTEEYMQGNYGFTELLLNILKKYKNKCPIMFASSIQARLNNEYGISKKAAEDLIADYNRQNGVTTYIYRFPNIFGKWCRPGYNSVIATFCYNISRNLPIHINNKETVLELVYIDDVVNEMVNALKGIPNINRNGYGFVPELYKNSLGEIAELLYSFKNGRITKEIPDTTKGGFIKKLYSTYLTYIPETSLSYPLEMKTDERGSFTEIIRTPDRGQFSVNIIKPGVTKGEHWHNTKNEKFVVVSGIGLIQLRRTGNDTGNTYPVLDYHVDGSKIEVIDIPPGYTHNITNEGESDLVVFIWSNEYFEQDKPDTYFLKVNEGFT
ncbi:MAG: NAD-dependent epimerase/dehydratase family protein [Lachnospiraceae bacterium]